MTIRVGPSVVFMRQAVHGGTSDRNSSRSGDRVRGHEVAGNAARKTSLWVTVHNS